MLYLEKTGFKKDYHYKYSYDSLSHSGVIQKKTPEFKMVFNAIAQGQAIDVICRLLDERGAKNYFVEIGGEIKTKGSKANGEPWRVGIDKPEANSTAANRTLMEIIELNNHAVATSGSYRQFYEKDGKKYNTYH